MNIKPISLRNANEFVTSYHRHNKAVTGHKWSLGLYENNILIGVGIVGRPIARMLDNGQTLEILRVCTNGKKNANSYLYGRIARIARLMGYERLITYTLKEESGASLRAIGAKPQKELQAQIWDRPNRRRKNQDVYSYRKIRWEL